MSCGFITSLSLYALWKYAKYRRSTIPFSIATPLTLPKNIDALAIWFKCHKFDENGQLNLYERKFWVQPKVGPVKDLEEKWSEAKVVGDENGGFCRIIMKGFMCVDE